MKLTNKFALPNLLQYAVANDSYSKGDSWRSVTQLIAPAKIAVLRERHDDELTEDVVDRLYTMQGQIAHGIIERASEAMKDHGWVSEQRLHTEILGKKVSGAFDLYHPATGELLDVKYSTGWSAKKGQAKPEWISQTNILAHLLRLHGFKVNRIRILLLIRDYSKPEANRDPDYPQDPAVYLEVPVWTDSDTKAFLTERVQIHVDAEKTLPDCTPEERWAKPTTWAIKKTGGTRAINGGVYADETLARRHLATLGKGYEIEFRPGQSLRCELYCNVNNFCEQFQATKPCSEASNIGPEVLRSVK